MHRIIAVCVIAACLMDSGSSASWSSEKQVAISNITHRSFTVSWETKKPEAGWVEYGLTPELGQVAYDVRGRDAEDVLHYVVLKDLTPATQYYFRLMPGKNRKQTMSQQTGPEIGLPGFKSLYGQAVDSEQSTPISGAIVYVELVDADGKDDSGQSTMMSAMTDALGYWGVELAFARIADLTDYFRYAEAGDGVKITVRGGTKGNSKKSLALKEADKSLKLELKDNGSD